MVEATYIAQRLRNARKSMGLDVDAVGKAVGRSGKTVSAWETGRNAPSADMLISLCSFFGVGIDYFYPPELSSTESLTPREQDLLDTFRALDERGKITVEGVARSQRGSGQDTGIQTVYEDIISKRNYTKFKLNKITLSFIVQISTSKK